MRKRIWLSAPFIALASMALIATRSDGKLETIEQIIPGVWFRQGDLDQYGHCNNIVIEMKDYLIVVDANYPSGARATMADIKKVSMKPVKYVFDTHHHGDHAYGNPLWTQAGATTFGYKGVAEEMRRYEPARWRADAARRKDVAELHRDYLTKEQVLCTGDALTNGPYNGMGDGYAANWPKVVKIYDEITQGKPRGEITGGK
jgi:cyclase